MYNANGTQFRTYDFNCEAPYNSDGLFGFQQPDFFFEHQELNYYGVVI